MHRQKSWILLLIVALLSTAAMAQTGSISGSVTDPSGAALQNVRITARNLATNALRVVSSGDVGTYSITNLAPGNYELTFESPGFKVLKFSHVVVTVAEVVPLNAEFTIRGTAETVEVKGLIESPVEVESSQVSNIVDTTKMANLPLLTRNPYELVLLSPGTIQSNYSAGRLFGQRIARAEQQFPTRWHGQQRYVSSWWGRRNHQLESRSHSGISSNYK